MLRIQRMFSEPLLYQGIQQIFKRGDQSILISIDIYRSSEGYTLVDFNTSEQLNAIKTITLISTLSYNSLVLKLLQMIDTLTDYYIADGKTFGFSVSQTISHHVPDQEVQYCTSSSTLLNLVRPGELSGGEC